MIQNKKGLSAIVTTLLVILLVLVAVGIVWGVVAGVLRSGAGQLDVGAECLNIQIAAVSTTCGAAAECNAVVERSGTSSEAVAGYKAVVKPAAGGTSSSVVNVEGDLAPLATTIIPFTDAPIGDGIIEVTVYFEDDSGAEQLCPEPSSFSFTA